MEKRFNCGYEIINSMQLKNKFNEDREVVMGYNEKAAEQYVVWRYDANRDSYEGGFYSTSKEAATREFFERGMGLVDLDLRAEYQRENELSDIEQVLGEDFNEKEIEALLKNEDFVANAIHRYDNVDHSAENEFLREELQDVYVLMVERKKFFDFALMEKLSNETVSVELRNGDCLTGQVSYNPKSSLSSFWIELNAETVKTNIGEVPLEDYLEMKSCEFGYDSYEELRADGMSIDIPKKYEIVEIQDVKKLLHNGEEVNLQRADFFDELIDENRFRMEEIESILFNKLGYPMSPLSVELQTLLIEYLSLNDEMKETVGFLIEADDVLYEADKKDMKELLSNTASFEKILEGYRELDTLTRERFIINVEMAFRDYHPIRDILIRASNIDEIINAAKKEAPAEKSGLKEVARDFEIE